MPPTTLRPRCPASIRQVRGWLYYVIGLLEDFDGCGWTKDCYAIGTWEDGHDSEPGTWTTSPLATVSSESL